MAFHEPESVNLFRDSSLGTVSKKLCKSDFWFKANSVRIGLLMCEAICRNCQKLFFDNSLTPAARLDRICISDKKQEIYGSVLAGEETPVSRWLFEEFDADRVVDGTYWRYYIRD